MSKINGVESGQYFAEERKRLNLDEKMFPKNAAERAYEARKAAEEKGATAAATKLGGEFKQAVSGPLLTAGSMQTPFTQSPAQQAAAAEQRMAQQGMDARATAESRRMTNLPAAPSGVDYAEPKSGLTIAGEVLGQAGIDRAPRVGLLLQKGSSALSSSINAAEEAKNIALTRAQEARDKIAKGINEQYSKTRLRAEKFNRIASTAEQTTPTQYARSKVANPNLIQNRPAVTRATERYNKFLESVNKRAVKAGEDTMRLSQEAGSMFDEAVKGSKEISSAMKTARRSSAISKNLGSISEGVKGAANLVKPLVKPAVKVVPFAAKGLKAAGRLNPLAAAAMEAYDVGRFVVSPEQREAMTKDIESKDTFLSAGVEGVLSPAKTILGAGNLAKQALEAREAARVSAADYGVLEERLAQRKPLIDELKAARRATMSDEEFNKLSSKERVAAMQAARKQVAQQRATAR